MSGSIICKGKYFVGRTEGIPGFDDGCEVNVTWELSERECGPEFSAQGEIWDVLHRDIERGGQCLDKLLKMFPDNSRLKEIHDVWKEWHLNGLTPGLPQQETAVREIEKKLIEEFQTRETSSRPFYDDEKTDPNWYVISHELGYDSYYSLMCAELKKLGLYECPVPEGTKCTGSFSEAVTSGERGYRYGERWVYRAIPQTVIDQIRSWTSE